MLDQIAIALDYDEASQAGQGALSHRIRLDEIEQQLTQLEPKFADLEQQLPELTAQVKLCKARFKASMSSRSRYKSSYNSLI